MKRNAERDKNGELFASQSQDWRMMMTLEGSMLRNLNYDKHSSKYGLYSFFLIMK